MKRVLIACAMMEDEVRCAIERTRADVDVVWVDRGYHSKPERLRSELQDRIDCAEAEGADQVLLAFGLCGNGAVGLRCRHAVLAMPRFDDCVNLMLQCGERTRRGLAKAGVMYLTRGWTQDTPATIVGQQRDYVRKYGERRAKRLMEAMFGAYRRVSVIDTGCFDVNPVMDAARESARVIDVEADCVEGSNLVLEKLLAGKWDDDILTCAPGRAVKQDDFEFAMPARC